MGEGGAIRREQQATLPTLSENLAVTDARAIFVSTAAGNFSPVRLAFAWHNIDTALVILWQFSFFHEFEVFFSSRQ